MQLLPPFPRNYYEKGGNNQLYFAATNSNLPHNRLRDQNPSIDTNTQTNQSPRNIFNAASHTGSQIANIEDGTATERPCLSLYNDVYMTNKAKISDLLSIAKYTIILSNNWRAVEERR